MFSSNDFQTDLTGPKPNYIYIDYVTGSEVRLFELRNEWLNEEYPFDGARKVLEVQGLEPSKVGDLGYFEDDLRRIGSEIWADNPVTRTVHRFGSSFQNSVQYGSFVIFEELPSRKPLLAFSPVKKKE